MSMLDALELPEDETFTYFVSYFFEAEHGICAGFANRVVRLAQRISKWNIEELLGYITAKLINEAEIHGLTPETIHIVIINFQLVE
jgi:hypothetical protein